MSFIYYYYLLFIYLFIMSHLNAQHLQIIPFRACLHGGGEPQVGEVTRLDGVTRLSIQSVILM